MEKLKVGKHNHSLTDLLKVLIFATVMCAPFIAVAVECLYIIVNKNAPTNYTGTPQYVFYEAVDNLGSQPLFNWTTSTRIYSVIEDMTDGLEFGTSSNTFAILLTYWSMNIVIYIIFDIIIASFKAITHLLQRTK